MSKLPPHTAAFDRGPSPYFHGRETIQRNFRNLLDRAHASNTGTTFLIQGAPGAGKTALLYECERHALQAGWNVVSIPTSSLWDTNELLSALGEGSKLNLTQGSGKVGINALLKIEAGVDFTLTKTDRTTLEVLRGAKKPLLLTLDEAQVLGTEGTPPTNHRSNAIDFLTFIHNGGLGKPIILLAAGLGTTRGSFGKLGISRFALGCLVELNALSKESEQLVIRDWLTKEGGCKGDPPEWVDAIVQETHGWPQHIQCYAGLASVHLQANGGVMSPDGLTSVLEAGHEARKAYYKGRLVDFRPSEAECLARLIADVQPGLPLDDMKIFSSMAQKFGNDHAKKLFKKFEEKGILEKTTMGYVVPIPSMHTWLIETYIPKKIEVSSETQKIRVERRRGLGFQR